MTTRPNPSSFRLGTELENEITQMASALDISRSQVVKRAVKHFIARQKHIDAVLSDARKSLTDYQATGLGVPFSEAAQWLRHGSRKEDMPTAQDMRK
ncbi:hypothetical protein LJB81_03285 [Desulfovibrio sp. OttesenSCG-928-M14]|nr:hypothetical protein [Desulfovibrio sp. OttesenSCG-928-M14]